MALIRSAPRRPATFAPDHRLRGSGQAGIRPARNRQGVSPYAIRPAAGSGLAAGIGQPSGAAALHALVLEARTTRAGLRARRRAAARTTRARAAAARAAAAPRAAPAAESNASSPTARYHSGISGSDSRALPGAAVQRLVGGPCPSARSRRARCQPPRALCRAVAVQPTRPLDVAGRRCTCSGHLRSSSASALPYPRCWRSSARTELRRWCQTTAPGAETDPSARVQQAPAHVDVVARPRGTADRSRRSPPARPAERHVAAGNVLGLAYPTAGRACGPPGALATHWAIGPSSPAAGCSARRPPRTRRPERGGQVRQPVGIGPGVVVDVRDDLAGRRPHARVARGCSDPRFSVSITRTPDARGDSARSSSVEPSSTTMTS